MKVIINAGLIVPDEAGRFILKKGQAVFFDRMIERIVPMTEAKLEGAEKVIDAAGCYVSPGFLNVHVHACRGCDAMDDDDKAVTVMQEFQAETGVTAFLPTTMTYDFPAIYRALEHIRQAMRQEKPAGAQVLGTHLEGPFINPVYKGAQAAENIMRADFAKIAPYHDVIRIITFAPEMLEGNYDFVASCQEAGIIPSIGHSAADYDTAMAAITQHGVHHITHLFNAMPHFHHRAPGIIGAAFDTAANCELITDNVHSHPAAQRMVWKAKGGQHVILITDSMRACGMGDGPSELGGQRVYVHGARATLEDGTIAGSVLTMDRAVKNFWQNTGAALPQMIETVTKTPAQELGVYERLGSIETGKQADFTIFDDEVQIAATVVQGNLVYKREKAE
jgi:N-acetylglucosamine-6-phosphate deacetylase